ncbi:hypothetical protein ACJIZ3_013917 [Penstemon smallii]|uniref:CTLH domain-containing protein n=1 Tax=Penstemon smallii TaxID=265156 RepID=A0ABD3RI12_9LAMI
MDFNSIRVALDHVTNEQDSASSKSQEIIQQITEEIEQALSRITTPSDQDSTASPTDHKSILNELKGKLNEICPLLENPQNELDTALNEHQSLLEESFIPDISEANRHKTDFDVSTLNQVIASHFYREGQFELGDGFLNESEELEAPIVRRSFQNMHRILEAIKNRNLEPALNWANNQYDRLTLNGCNIRFEIHSLKYVDILENRGCVEGLKYAKQFLAPFASAYWYKFRKVISCVIYAGRLNSSPYKEFVSSEKWEELAKQFTGLYCNVIGQPCKKSPLSVTIDAGCHILPTFIKEEPTEEIKMDDEFYFHSTFYCPASWELARGYNRPMRLPCGHFVCWQTLVKLCNANPFSVFKCPVCRARSKGNQCHRVFI